MSLVLARMMLQLGLQQGISLSLWPYLVAEVEAVEGQQVFPRLLYLQALEAEEVT
ncbi:hypothetical protein [uncultured Thiodictyon sp.]|uniref:hypothetical protein n=1 Tax=uncultured Thiodictyon sp. TaxID=1846217 RepID=UPI0025F05B46|nr:hypothetical protein [uncultured Thiodictyon sp.]